MNIVQRVGELYRKEYRRNPVFTAFLTVLASFLLIFTLFAAITEGETLYRVLGWYKQDTFMDYFNSVIHSHGYPYTESKVVYPPLATVFYSIIGYFIIPSGDWSETAEVSVFIRDTQLGIMSFFVVTMLTFYILYLVFSRIMKNFGTRKDIFFVLLFLSYPFVFALERGNSIIMALVFCLIFLVGYRSENKTMRYISYIALGCAAGFKLYPAILWLLIFKDGTRSDTKISALIVATVVLLPFIFTDGNPLMLIDTIINYMDNTSSDSAIAGFFNLKQMVFDLLPNISIDVASIIGYVAVGILTILSIVVTLYDKEMKQWKTIALLSCNLVLGLGVGTQYTTVYMAMPIIFFLANEKEMTKNNIFYLFSFAMIMVLVPGFENMPVSMGSVRTLFVLIIASALIIEGFHGLRYRSKTVSEQPHEPSEHAIDANAIK